MSYPPSSPSSSSTSSNNGYHYDYRTGSSEKKQRKEQARNTAAKHPYMSEFRERRGSTSEESTGPYDYIPPARRQKGFFRRLTSFSCFEFDDSDPVARYRPRHEAIFGKNPVYRNHQIQPQNENQAKMIPSENQAPNSFAGGTTGGSGTGGGCA